MKNLLKNISMQLLRMKGDLEKDYIAYCNDVKEVIHFCNLYNRKNQDVEYTIELYRKLDAALLKFREEVSSLMKEIKAENGKEA